MTGAPPARQESPRGWIPFSNTCAERGVPRGCQVAPSPDLQVRGVVTMGLILPGMAEQRGYIPGTRRGTVGPGDGAPLGRLGGYRLRTLLGTGGMAEVYRALDPRLGREVAVKVLPAPLATDPNYVARFRDEARRVAALNHPHIVPVYHYGEDGGLLYLVMPILRESLRDKLSREGTLQPTEAGRIAVEIASALEAAHDRGLV